MLFLDYGKNIFPYFDSKRKRTESEKVCCTNFVAYFGITCMIEYADLQADLTHDPLDLHEIYFRELSSKVRKILLATEQ